MPWTKANFYGTNASRMDEHLSTTASDLEDSTSKTPENIAEVREAILADCRQTIHNVCEIVGLSYGTHFGGQFEHETHFCEICAKTAEWRPEGPLCFRLWGTQTTSQRRPQLHLQYHNRCWNMGVWLWRWD